MRKRIRRFPRVVLGSEIDVAAKRVDVVGALEVEFEDRLVGQSCRDRLERAAIQADSRAMAPLKR